jgi:hypothetical protein
MNISDRFVHNLVVLQGQGNCADYGKCTPCACLLFSVHKSHQLRLADPEWRLQKLC